MSLEIRHPKADALARELSAATGEDADTAVLPPSGSGQRASHAGDP